MKFFSLLLILWMGMHVAVAQDTGRSQRSSLHFLYGPSGANVRDFNEMLASKGLSPLRKGYNSYGVAYQSRFNDLVVGMEIVHNNGPTSDFRNYELGYRSTRINMNVGYSFTEEDQRIQLIHFMSFGMGYLNFEMLKDRGGLSMPEFLEDPRQGFIIRQNDLHKGTLNMGGFLTEIGFQVSYDIFLAGGEETVELVSKFGYSFSPFEDAWNNKGLAFDNIQSGAFFKLGAGISLPDRNYFYRDAALAVNIFYGLHLTRPNQLNTQLVTAGYRPFSGHPSNVGITILGENRGRHYGLDFYNLSQKGKATDDYNHTLNSIKIYGNLGRKLYQRKNLEMGFLAGVGFANIRYTLDNVRKPDFPYLFEEPDFDGYLKNWGFTSKPEIYISYATSISNKNVFDLVYSLRTGYELPISSFSLADVDMKKYMTGPYLQLGIGIRP